MKRYFPEKGRTLQGFCFALDPTPEALSAIMRHFGARRFVHNWAVEQLVEERAVYRQTGESGELPSLKRLRKMWNSVKGRVAVGRLDRLPWWQEVSKEAFSSGIADAAEAYWNWVKAVRGERSGRWVGFPRFKKRGVDPDRYRITTGSFGPCDDRHVKVPRVGVVRVHENMRRLTRLIAKGRAKILSATVERRGARCFIVFQADVLRWPAKPPDSTGMRVGVDLGVRRLATVATPDGKVIEVVPNPRALDEALGDLRRLYRARSRCSSKSSFRYRQRTGQISKLHRKIADIRRNAIHVFTTRLAKTHGEIVVEGMNVAGLMKQKGLPGVRKRRRDLADASMGEVRRQLRYKVSWYGGKLIEADPFFPSSKLCSVCGVLGDPGWAEVWECAECGAVHQRDDNAAVNLSRYSGDGGTVGASGRRGGSVRPSFEGAAGREASKLGERSGGLEPALV